MQFEKLVEIVEAQIRQHGNINQELRKIAAKVYMDASKRAPDDKYCLAFKIPDKEVKELISKLGLTEKDFKEAFEKKYGFPKNSNMYGNAYYHVLLTLYYVYKKLHLDDYARMSLFLILIRIWNGRKYHYIKYCNKDIMEYVIHQKLSKRSLATKYPSPLELIVSYFVDTIDKKYGPMILHDDTKLKLLFNQCFVRIDQLFNNSINTGLANYYFKVHESGEAFRTTSLIQKDNEGELTLADIESKSAILQRIAETVAHTIVLTRVQYSQDFINYINKVTKVSKVNIEKLAHALHDRKYQDKIYELVVIMLHRIGMYSKEQLCNTPNLIKLLDKQLISSKHNKDVEEYKKILSDIADDILKTHFNRTLDSLSMKVQILRILTYVLGYNMVNIVCTTVQ